MDRILWSGIGSRFSFRSLPLSTEPLIINRNSRVIDATRVAITPVDNSNLRDIAISSQQTPVTTTVPAPSRQTVGDFVVDTRIIPYIKPRRLFIEMTGMRPSINVNIFFDRQNVNAFCIPASLSNGTFTQTNVVPNGSKGDQLTVGTDGKLYFMFDIPAGTFFTGDRELIATDVSNLNSISSASTKTSLVYYGFNFTPRPAAIRPVPIPTRVITARSRPRRTTIGRRDPLAQTFFVSSELSRGTEGLYASKVDIYFQTKSSTFGVTVELREVVNGVPTDIVLPFSKKRLESSSVNTSATAATATTFTFSSPVFLSAGNEYAVVIIPDGNNPDYKIWTSETGATDVLTSTDTTSNWGEGTLFFSTNGSAWTPVQAEDMKFTLYRAKFNQTTTSVKETPQATFVNDDYEFITSSVITGTPVVGEQVFNSSIPVITGGTTGISTAGSVTVSGIGTAFTTELGIGQQIVITSGSTSAIRIIKSIETATSLTLESPVNFTSAGASLQKGTIGTIEYISIQDNKVRLIDSNATATAKFSSPNVLKTESGAAITIASVDDKTINFFQPSIPRQILNGTSIDFSRTGIYRDGNTFSNNKIELGNTNYVVENEMVIKSKSNEGGTKSFNLIANMSIGLEDDGINLRNTISPSIDQTGVSLSSFANIINNDSTNEYKSLIGSAKTKYISKRISLEDGMDAEDVNVIITGYRPSGSDIEVYIKVINSLDPGDFDDKNWSLLEQTDGKEVFSDRHNLGDYKEYTYSISTTPVSAVMTGPVTVTTSSANVTGTGTTFVNGTIKLVPGDTVQITDPVFGNYQIGKVKTVTSDTAIIMDEVITLPSNSGQIISKLQDPETAFKNPQNSDIVRYYDANGVSYDTFKMYAVKIVLKSSTNYIIPKIKDLRVISLSI